MSWSFVTRQNKVLPAHFKHKLEPPSLSLSHSFSIYCFPFLFSRSYIFFLSLFCIFVVHIFALFICANLFDVLFLCCWALDHFFLSFWFGFCSICLHPETDDKTFRRLECCKVCHPLFTCNCFRSCYFFILFLFVCSLFSFLSLSLFLFLFYFGHCCVTLFV